METQVRDIKSVEQKIFEHTIQQAIFYVGLLRDVRQLQYTKEEISSNSMWSAAEGCEQVFKYIFRDKVATTFPLSDQPESVCETIGINWPLKNTIGINEQVGVGEGRATAADKVEIYSVTAKIVIEGKYHIDGQCMSIV